TAALHVHMGCPVHLRVILLRDQQSAVGAVERVAEAVTVEVHQCLGHLALDRDVGEDHFVDAVEIPLVERRHLVYPFHLAGIHVAGPDGHAPLVVAGTLRRVPGAWIARAVVHEIQRLVVAVPAPGGTAADLPHVLLPGLERRILSDRLHLAVHPGGGSTWINQHLIVRYGAVALPDQIACFFVEGGETTAYTPFASADAGNHLVLEDVRRVGIHRTYARITVGHRPQDFAGGGIESDQRAVRLLQEQLAFRVGEAAIHRVTTHLRN